MYLYMRFLVLLLKFLSHVSAFPERADLISPNVNSVLTALRRNEDTQEIYSRELNCQVDMAGIEGEYYYTYKGHGDTCYIYFIVDEHNVVEIDFIEANFQCSDDGTDVQWYDGWTMGIGSFPSSDDHPLRQSERLQTICHESSSPLTYRAHQNAAMLMFKFSSRGDSLRIILKSKRIPEPCNVMAKDPSGLYTLSNYGTAKNCSLSVIYPTRIGVVEMRVGEPQIDATLGCKDTTDYLEFLAGNDLDRAFMRQDAVLCGSSGRHSQSLAARGGSASTSGSRDSAHTSPRNAHLHEDPSCAHGININLNCQNSVVRLVSGDGKDNTVTFEYSEGFEAKNDCEALTYY